ncbi:gamma-tubulin complex component 4 isoform X3 [Hydra vulgaris]|uniref:Gamma-tubulin complex component n=1 Tax=Hydra vulgaris TaxID=6087 RepID=A0ABM4DDS7_HYDVU
MFHELLVALSGTPGAIFKVNQDTNEIEVTKNLPFVHPSETELLNKICKLGGYYRMFENFIEKFSVDLVPVNLILKTEIVKQNQGLQGQYLHAFCAGLSLVLQPYLQTLIHIEDQIIRDPHTPLSRLHQELEEYFFVFPTLMNMINKIQNKKVHGCQILELLQKTSYCGVPPIKAAVEKILHTCHGVLYKQLSAWMLHGLLVDNYHEFFIVDKKNMKLREERKLSEEDYVDGATMSSNMALRDVKGNEFNEEMLLTESTPSTNESSRITIVPSMLPSYIPTRVAEKVLFIGQSVQMLKDTENLKANNYNSRTSSILQGRETEFLQTLYQLQNQSHLSIPALEVEIDKIKACVAEQLWRLVVEEADLMKHLRLLKEMYLLGRGELYLTFVDHVFYLMKGPSSSTGAYDINAAFKQCLAKILAYSEEHESLFSMTLDASVQGHENEPGYTKTTWDYLRLSYNPPWPLHLLFTQSVMEKYGALFTFLLRVRRTQIELQNVWCLQMTSRRKLSKKKSASILWALRSRMAFFVDNFQYYLQVDVLESQFSLLLEKIKKLRDFESIHKSHDSFLITMLQQSFISMKPVLSILQHVLEICMKFCELVSYNRDSDDDLETALQYTQDFDRQTSVLFKILSSVRSHQTSPHLAQLLLRIDFNKYFTRKSELL